MVKVPPPSGDLQPFVRQTEFTHGRLDWLWGGREEWMIKHLGPNCDPQTVPWWALDGMRTHPVLYLGERTISGIMRQPDLFSVQHEDPKIQKEVEEWLWPLLPTVLGAAARAFSYGHTAIVFDWGREELVTQVPSGERTRRRRIRDHIHYVKAHEIHPANMLVELQDDDSLEHVDVDGVLYGPDRTILLSWDAAWGHYWGQSALRRAWRDYAGSLVTEMLHLRYLERSVDAPRIGYAPSGRIEKTDGTKQSQAARMRQLLMALRGSGTVILPENRDENGNRLYEIDLLDVPDREQIWQTALDRFDSRMLISFLVAPGTAGLEALGAGAGRFIDGVLRDFIEQLANFAATSLTKVVERVHVANHDPSLVRAPEVVATDVGKASARKILQSVLQIAANSGAGAEVAVRTDVPAVLDRLGVPLRDEAPEQTAPGPENEPPVGDPGPERDPNSDREERREDARTPEGEDDTGMPRDEDGEPE